MANGVRLVDLLKRDSEWEFCRAEELGQVEVETCPVTRLAVDDMVEASGLAEAPPPEYHVDMTSVQRGHVSGGWEHHDCDDDGFEYPASLTQGSPGCGKMAWSSRVDILRSEKDRPVEDAGPAKRVLLPSQPAPLAVREQQEENREQQQKANEPHDQPLFDHHLKSKDVQPQQEGKQATPGVMFTTGGGAALKISKSKLEAASRLFDGLEDTPAKQNNNNNDDDDKKENIMKGQASAPSNMFMTGSGSKISISKDKMAAAAKLLDLDEDSDTTPSRSVSKNSNTTPAPKDVQASVALAKTPAPAGKGWTASRSRFAPPGASGSTFTAPSKKKMPEFQTPGNHAAVAKRHRSSTSSVEHANTPGLVTPQVFQQTKQVPHSTETRHMNTPVKKVELPLTPQLASRYLFYGNYGPGDVRSLLLTSGAKPDVVQDDWVRNHYMWVVWKLALVELHLDRPGTRLTFDSVHKELQHRYQKEYVQGKKSFLKGVLQRDYPLKVPCVLKVASIQQSPQAAVLELSDGWYSITCNCDEKLALLAAQRRIYVGLKLRLVGAELVGGNPGEPLVATKETRVFLQYNQVHPIHYTSKLGIQKYNRIPVTPISAIDEKGGTIPRTVVSVLCVFPPLMWSKLPSGVSTFQTVSLAAKAETCLDAELEKIADKVKDDVEKEEIHMCSLWLKQGKPDGMKKVERLYASLVTSAGGDDFMETLNESDKMCLEKYVAERRMELQDIQQQRCREMLGSEVPSALGASSIPCQTLLVGEVSKQSSPGLGPMEYFSSSIRSVKTALLTLWKPRDDMLRLKEGDILSITSVDVFKRDVKSQIYRGPFLESLKHLQTSPKSVCTQVERAKIDATRVVQGSSHIRNVTIQKLLRDANGGYMLPNLISMKGIVLKASSPSLASDYSHHFQWIFAIDASQQGNESAWTMAILLAGPQDAIKWVDDTKAWTSYHSFENVEVFGFDHSNQIIQIKASMGTSITTMPLEENTASVSQNTPLLESLRDKANKLLSS